MLFCHIVLRTSAVLALACAVVVFSAQQPGPAPITLVQLAELPRLIDPQLSPNGRAVAYMLATADWNAGRQTFHLWRQDIGAAAAVPLTNGPSDAPGSTRWSPDASSILFARGGQLMLVTATGGDARPVTKHATGVAAPTWSRDGATIYFTAADAPTSDDRERDKRKDDVYAFEEREKFRQLWSVDVKTGEERQLTRGNFSVVSYRLSGDGRRVVVERAPTPLQDDAHKAEVWLMNADGSGARQLTQNNVFEQQPELSPDGTQILFISDTNERLEPYYNQNLFVVSAQGGAPKPVIADFPYGVDQASWAPDGRSILLVANMGVHSEIFSVDLASRRATQLTEGRHFIPPGWNVVPAAGKMAFQLDEPARFGDVWTLPIPSTDVAAAAREQPTRITGVYDTMEKTYAIPRQEKVAWKSKDGVPIEGILFYPAGYSPGTRYPLVVQMHGGPEESDKFGAGPGLLLNYFPVLTGKGWFVFRPNYRGSTGYGNTFYRDVITGYFKNMQYDILTGVDTLAKQGLVDPQRVVLMGWSAGGHLTNKLVTMTDRFKAASSGAGVGNWLSLYAQSDTRDNRTTWFGGTPWQKNAPFTTYWNQSPVKDAANVKTPTLFFVGENDVRVPLQQSVEMYRALKSHGVPTHLYVAPREGHQWQELRHQIFKANTELTWFSHYALGTSYTAEVAPAPSQ